MKHNMLNVETRRNWVPGNRSDPYLAYNFLVRIDGITVAGFTEVSGLNIETQVERKTFGGENDREYVFITQTKFNDITLKHGITRDDYLWRWYESVINGQVRRRHGSICLMDHMGNAAIWWDLFDACPIKWEGPALNSASSTVAIETLVLTHQGIYKRK